MIESADLPQALQLNQGGEEDSIRAGMTIKEMERILIEKNPGGHRRQPHPRGPDA